MAANPCQRFAAACRRGTKSQDFSAFFYLKALKLSENKLARYLLNTMETLSGRQVRRKKWQLSIPT
jgi:hypothetical protein